MSDGEHLKAINEQKARSREFYGSPRRKKGGLCVLGYVLFCGGFSAGLLAVKYAVTLLA